MVTDFAEGLGAARSLEDVTREVRLLRERLDVEHVVFHAVNASGGEYAVPTYSDDWSDRYMSEGYSRIDPVVQTAFRSFAPVDWTDIDFSGRGVRDFMQEAYDAGVGRHGLSVPIRGPSGQFALFTVNQRGSDRAWQTLLRERRDHLLLMAHHINETVLRITKGHLPDQTDTARLSPRETDVLTLLAIGLSRAQAAEHLALSEHTIRAYIESARDKLQALNTVHAVARALSQGQIVL